MRRGFLSFSCNFNISKVDVDTGHGFTVRVFIRMYPTHRKTTGLAWMHAYEHLS